MNTLRIYTRFPAPVVELLRSYSLVESVLHLPIDETPKDLELPYPDDALSQELTFWLAMALGCGLISGYKLLTPRMLKEDAARKRAIQHLEHRISCYMDGKRTSPPGE